MFLLLDEMDKEMKTQLKGLILLSFAALTFAGLVFTDKTGGFGFFLNSLLRIISGDVALLVPVIFTLISINIFLPKKVKNVKFRIVGLLVLLTIIIIATHMRTLTSIGILPDESFYSVSIRTGLGQEGGGLLGALFSIILFFFFREVGSYIVILTLLVISFILITNITITKLIIFTRNSINIFVKNIKGLIYNFFAVLKNSNLQESKNKSKAVPENEEKIKENDIDNINREKVLISSDLVNKKKTITDNENIDEDIEKLSYLDSEFEKVQDNSQQEQDSLGLIRPLQKEHHKNNYLVPEISLLPKLINLKDKKQAKHVGEQAKNLERTLLSFGVQAKVSGYDVGPTVTRFELQPESGVKVSKILSLSNDLALNLAAPDVRIEAPIPGKAAIGIEVPNKVVSLVYLREVLESKAFKEQNSPLTVGLGRDITGKAVVTDLLKMPHLLVAGSTGSGKSVCINTIIASILFKSTPQEVKFLMIDPKIVELGVYNNIPHLITPVINSAPKAAHSLKSMVKEMNQRYEVFARHGARDIGSYNKKMIEEELIEDVLPYIVVIIDELADLMMVAPADVEDSIARLSQMARAAGIHLIIATQRPSVDVITGVIKANITSRIAFAVSSQADSRTILDIGGAEKLLGRGDMLFHPTGISKPFRIQGAYISDKDIKTIIEYIKDQNIDIEINDSLNIDESIEQEEEIEEADDLLSEATNLVAETGQASISLLQRRLRIGYTRAARLVDDMERRGLIGKYEGSKPREVLITPETAKEMFEIESSNT